MTKKTYFDFALDTFEKHVDRFHKKYLSLNKLPKETDWRPYRFAVQDVILGLTVVRHNQYDNLLEVEVCLMTDPPQFPQHSGARIMMIALLSEAFRCGGSMEIRFTEQVLHSTVPREIVWFAESLGLQLNHVDEGHITPKESRDLFIALTSFSPDAETKIMQLAVQKKVRPERVCFMVHNKIWELAEAESILLGAQMPDRVLLGSSFPEEGVLYTHDLMYARLAVLGGFLDRKLKQRERIVDGMAVEYESDERKIRIGFVESYFSKVYMSDEVVPIPWLADETTLPPGQRLYALVRARNSSDFMLNMQDDLLASQELKNATNADGYYVILVPRDFEEIPGDTRELFVNEAHNLGYQLMVCPESVTGLDKDASARLDRSRMIRR